ATGCSGGGGSSGGSGRGGGGGGGWGSFFFSPTPAGGRGWASLPAPTWARGGGADASNGGGGGGAPAGGGGGGGRAGRTRGARSRRSTWSCTSSRKRGALRSTPCARIWAAFCKGWPAGGSAIAGGAGGSRRDEPRAGGPARRLQAMDLAAPAARVPLLTDLL